MKIAILKGRGQNHFPIEDVLRQLFQTVSPAEADILVVLGGDGTMTHWCKELVSLQKPFYGINRGTFGFLLNDHSEEDDLVAAIAVAEVVDFPLLEATITFSSGEVKKALAFNDIFTKTTSAQAAKHQVTINGLSLFAEKTGFMSGDGLIVCTPGGSTAYNRAAGGIIIDHKADSLGLTPVSVFEPIDFRPQLLPGDSVIQLTMMEDEKRQHLVITDNVEFRQVKTVTIRRSELQVQLGFKPDNSYFRKTMRLRFPWLKT